MQSDQTRCKLCNIVVSQLDKPNHICATMNMPSKTRISVITHTSAVNQFSPEKEDPLSLEEIDDSLMAGKSCPETPKKKTLPSRNSDNLLLDRETIAEKSPVKPSEVSGESPGIKQKRSKVNILCQSCVQYFTSKSKLKQHRILFHERHFKCVLCGKLYAKEGYLSMHERQAHTDTNFYKCPKCMNRFLTITRLQTHACLSDVSDNIPGTSKNIEEPSTSSPKEPNINFLCKYFPQTFSSKLYVKRHLEIYHQMRTQFKCIICDRFYVTEGMLSSHERKSHADKSFYRCITCSNRFLTDLEYQRHKCNPS